MGRRFVLASESTERIAASELDDAHDEGLRMGRRILAGRRRLVTTMERFGRENVGRRDPLPRAPLARFGRTTAVHLGEHVEERWQAPRVPGFGGVARSGSCG